MVHSMLAQNRSRDEIATMLRNEFGFQDFHLQASDTTYQELIHTGRNWVPETQFRSVAPFVQLSKALVGERLHLGAARAPRA